jgi:ketosteroid isomerase-like protein
MSQQNVEMVRNMLERFAEGHEPQLDAVADDSVWSMATFAGWPEDQEYVGPDGITRFVRAWVDAWEDYDFTIEEVVDAGDRVLAIVRQSGTARGSQARVDMHLAQVYLIEGSVFRRVDNYDDLAEARSAAGLGVDPS